MKNELNPVSTKQRYIILDALRGIALLGICLANYPEFALYTFQPKEVLEAMPTAESDTIVRFFQYFLIDGKFYTLFSLLFGIGFSIVISGYMQKSNHGLLLFYKRMLILFVIGLFHLIFLWAGDIVILYAFVGLFLPLFRNAGNKKLLIFSTVLIFFPVLIDICIVLFRWNLASPAINATQYFHGMVGITDENFPVWLVEAQHYRQVVEFNLGGSFIRIQEFIEGNRVFKVLGLFLLGLYIGKNKLYAKLENNTALLKKVRFYGLLIGIPGSLLYAWNAVAGYPLGLIGTAVIYAVSVIPMSLGYISFICIWYTRHTDSKFFKIMAAPGRMALTNYLMQSVIGMFIFYGFGFALGAKLGLGYIELIALGVFVFQVIYSYIWLKYLQFGPVEWIWRMLTYGKWLEIVKKK